MGWAQSADAFLSPGGEDDSLIGQSHGNSFNPHLCLMKTSRFITTLQALILATANLAVTSDAQTAAPPPASNASQPTPQTGNYQIIEAGANHRVWQRIDYETLRSGKTIPHIHKYTELATGLNHLVNGQWV